jgi:hypothetical protein
MMTDDYSVAADMMCASSKLTVATGKLSNRGDKTVPTALLFLRQKNLTTSYLSLGHDQQKLTKGVGNCNLDGAMRYSRLVSLWRAHKTQAPGLLIV